LHGRHRHTAEHAGRESWRYSTASGNGAPDSQSHQAGQDPLLARYYANLELPYGADLATVRQAWKKLLRKYHPDLHSHDPEKRRMATELTQGLNRAYEELEKRLTPS
jgi:DnaJ-domain-containing protein 1